MTQAPAGQNRAQRLKEQDDAADQEEAEWANVHKTPKEKADAWIVNKHIPLEKIILAEFSAALEKRGFTGFPYYIETVYNDYINDLGFRKAMNAWIHHGTTGDAKFNKAFVYARDTNENLIIFIYGPKRVGKSKVARSLAERGNFMVKHNSQWHMDPDAPDESMNHVLDGLTDADGFLDNYETYSYPEAKKVIPRLTRQNWLIVDEMPDERDEGSVRIKKDINTFLKVASGKHGLNITLLNQYYVFVKNVQIVIQIIATDKVNFKTLVRIQIQEKDLLTTSDILVIDVSKEPKELNDLYEAVNDRKKKACQDKGGTSMQGIDINDVKRVTDEYHKIPADVLEIIGDPKGTQKALDVWVTTCDALSDVAGNPRRPSIVTLAFNRLNEKKKKKDDDSELDDIEISDPPAEPCGNGGHLAPVSDLVEPVAPGMPFHFDIDAAIERYKHLEGGNREREALIFLALQKFSDDYVGKEYPNMQTGKPLTPNGLIDVEERVTGMLSLWIGHAYEPHFEKEKRAELGSGWDFKHSNTAGQGQADVIANHASGNVIIYSLKVRYAAKSKTQKLKIDKFQAELDIWSQIVNERPGKTIRLIFVYYDHNCGCHVEKEVINPLQPPETIRLSRASGMPEIKFIS